MSRLFQYENGELFFTKITRPLSFWIVLLSFLVLLFLNSFGIVKTDSLYLEILKQVLITMSGFYFTLRTIDKYAEYKYKKYNDIISLKNQEKNIDFKINEIDNKKEIDPKRVL